VPHPTKTEPGATRWPLERVLFALAGTVSLLSVVLAVNVSPWFLLLTVFVGLNQWLYVTVGNCPASLLLARVGIKAKCSCLEAPLLDARSPRL
jgi:hypothetical protein